MNFILDTRTVIAADLDGTLCPSKSPISAEMSQILSKWLETHRFAIISGGKYQQFVEQVISKLPSSTKFENLFIFPLIGSACYAFKNGAWVKVYEDTMTDEEKKSIGEAINKALVLSEITVDHLYGEQIEYQSAEVTFSALGQEAPLEKKLPWDFNHEKRKLIVSHLLPLLTDYTVSIGGTTTINITKKGVDKAYAIEKMKELLRVDNDHVVFLGDALYEGGNDWAVTQTGVTVIPVKDPLDSISQIMALMK